MLIYTFAHVIIILQGGDILNKRIRLIRDEEKLSQEKFGKVIGVSRDTIANIEAGRIEIKDIFIASICREFRINEDWLRTGKGEMKKGRNKNEEISIFLNDIMEDVDDSFKKRFIRALSKLNESDWETLSKIADELEKED